MKWLFVVAGLGAVAVVSVPVIAQQRFCVVDDFDRLVCGRPATEQEIRQVFGGYNRGSSGHSGFGRPSHGRSSQLRDANEAINRIYRDILDRDADFEGLQTYRNRIARGWSLSAVRSDLVGSREVERALDRQYREVLGRPIDGRGLGTYRRRLAGGWSLRDVRRDLQDSDEARRRR